MFTYKVAWLY